MSIARACTDPSVKSPKTWRILTTEHPTVRTAAASTAQDPDSIQGKNASTGWAHRAGGRAGKPDVIMSPAASLSIVPPEHVMRRGGGNRREG
ncbi:hypothetical protein RRF57_003633 [Xylaria bambusicola]|uniref:Uncharacterized protein n=1 Tax=Xylaria bambusicola TaxID=326684 RepID=A0AAN7UHS4_9PEZI